MQQLISTKEAASRLGISRHKLYQIIKTDPSFPARFIGSNWRVFPDKLEEWIENCPGAGTRPQKISGTVYQLNIPREKEGRSKKIAAHGGK